MHVVFEDKALEGVLNSRDSFQLSFPPPLTLHPFSFFKAANTAHLEKHRHFTIVVPIRVKEMVGMEGGL